MKRSGPIYQIIYFVCMLIYIYMMYLYTYKRVFFFSTNWLYNILVIYTLVDSNITVETKFSQNAPLPIDQ